MELKNKKNILFTLAAVVVLAMTALCFFSPAIFEGEVLQQHDIRQGLANGHEIQQVEAATGEQPRWTDSLFGGMPTFQIAPSYATSKWLGWIQTIFGLGLPSPANLLFMMMAGFFIMCLCMRMKWPTALFASVAWGLSTYFIIIIGAGHIWKFLTLIYIPPTIGGLALLYRGKYLSGTALTALFASMQLMSNHPQMSYYFLFVILGLVIALGVIALREKMMRRWLTATGLAVVAGGLAIAVNSASLYNSYEYSKETVRGTATLIADADSADSPAQGMDRDAITAWSYGLDETFSLMIPNVKGGATIKPFGGENRIMSVADTPYAQKSYLSQQELQFLDQFPQYFGNQPMTNGPVYVGIIVLALAILALFVVDGPVYGPIKWALFVVSVLAIALAWGHNFPLLTDFFIDSFPGYNKFRAVASILVIPEFCIPLLAALCIIKMTDTPDFLAKYRWNLYTVFGLIALVCLAGWISPSIFGTPFSVSELRQLGEMGILNDPNYAPIINSIREARLELVSADALRSLVFLLIGWGVIFLRLRGAFNNNTLFVCALTAVVLIDLFTVNRRYVDADNFTTPAPQSEEFTMTDADKEILNDERSMNYRVADIDDFGGARSSYFHHTVGGYHAAKLTRYNDLLTHLISPSLHSGVMKAAEYYNNPDSMMNVVVRPDILDLLNTRWYIVNNMAIPNPYALGNAFFVDRIEYVETPAEEMQMMKNINLGKTAVADKSFEKILGNASRVMPTDYIMETFYQPGHLEYEANTTNGGIAVFSEIYFPWGWEVTIDGAPAEPACVDYALRGLRIPAGKHKVVMSFQPKSLEYTNAVGIAACIIIFILLLLCLLRGVKCVRDGIKH